MRSHERRGGRSHKPSARKHGCRFKRTLVGLVVAIVMVEVVMQVVLKFGYRRLQPFPVMSLVLRLSGELVGGKAGEAGAAGPAGPAGPALVSHDTGMTRTVSHGTVPAPHSTEEVGQAWTTGTSLEHTGNALSHGGRGTSLEHTVNALSWVSGNHGGRRPCTLAELDIRDSVYIDLEGGGGENGTDWASYGERWERLDGVTPAVKVCNPTQLDNPTYPNNPTNPNNPTYTHILAYADNPTCSASPVNPMNSTNPTNSMNPTLLYVR
jgi:hypothetical protein